MPTTLEPQLFDKVEEGLKDVIDPELGVNIVDLGLIYDLAWDEENLCLDPELARLDREMAAAFGKAKAAAQGAARTSLVRGQRAWIAGRGTGCDADKRRTCLLEAYRKRLRELEGSR